MDAKKPEEPFVPPAGAPRRRRQRSILSANILISYLQRFNILAAPANPTAQFKWMIALFGEDDFAAIKEIDPGMLCICRAQDAPGYLRRLPSMFFVAITSETEVPDWVDENAGRVVLIQSDEDPLFLAFQVKSLFASLLVWENELDGMVLRKETIAALLTEASLMTRCFTCMVDAGYSLIAASEKTPPADEVHRELLANGCYSDEAAQCIEEALRKKGKRERERERERDYRLPPVVHLPRASRGLRRKPLRAARRRGQRGVFRKGAARPVQHGGR